MIRTIKDTSVKNNFESLHLLFLEVIYHLAGDLADYSESSKVTLIENIFYLLENNT